MKRWLITPVLGGMLLSATWASAQQSDPPEAAPAAQAGSIGVQSGPVAVTVTGSGAAVVPGSGMPVHPGLPMTPPAGSAGGGGFGGSGGFGGGGFGSGFGGGGFGGGNPPWISSAVATLAGKAERTAFLGVVTTRVTGTLRSQLKLKAGLVVETVEPKSSAEAAGLQVHDIIEKCDDQWLINPAQFIGLIRMYKPGETITLTVLREGERKKVTAKLEERETYALEDEGDALHVLKSIVEPNNPQGTVRAFGASGGGAFGGSSTAGPVQRITAGGLGVAPLASGFVATFGDDKHQLMITMRDGRQILTLTDSSGKTIFMGPVDTPEQRKLLPEDARKKLEEMWKIKAKIRQPNWDEPGFDYDPRSPHAR